MDIQMNLQRDFIKFYFQNSLKYLKNCRHGYLYPWPGLIGLILLLRLHITKSSEFCIIWSPKHKKNLTWSPENPTCACLSTNVLIINKRSSLRRVLGFQALFYSEIFQTGFQPSLIQQGRTPSLTRQKILDKEDKNGH